MILAIDTSEGTSVSLLDSGDVVSRRVDADRHAHAEVIGELIRSVLAAVAGSRSRLDLVATGRGPGAFTGLRVGMAAASAFAFALDLPLVGVSSHDAIARRYYADHNGGRLVVETEAKRNEVFWTAYAGVDELGLPVVATDPNTLRRGFPLPAEWSAMTLLGEERDRSVAISDQVAEIAWVRSEHRIAQEPALPHYVRSPDVMPARAPKRVLS